MKDLGRAGAAARPVEAHVAGGEGVLQEVIADGGLVEHLLERADLLDPLLARGGERPGDGLGVQVAPFTRGQRL